MPFGEGLDAGKGEIEWIVARDKPKYYANHLQNMHDIRVNNHCLSFQTPFEQLVKTFFRYDEVFQTLEQNNGKITGKSLEHLSILMTARNKMK